jgi:hypothetical protein
MAGADGPVVLAGDGRGVDVAAKGSDSPAVDNLVVSSSTVSHWHAWITEHGAHGTEVIFRILTTQAQEDRDGA